MPAESSAERQILNLLYRYAELVDDADFDGVGELFADADYRIGERASARHDEVAETIRRGVVLHDGELRTKHVVTNTIVELHRGHPQRHDASARSYFTVLQAAPGLPLQPIVAGRYLDTFREIRRAPASPPSGDVTDDAVDANVETTWQFASRHVVLDLVGDMSRHAKRPPEPHA